MFDYFTLSNLWQFIRIILDITLVWVVFYYCLKIVKNNSRTIQIFKGILLIMIVKGLANFIGLATIEYLADLFVQWGAIAVIIIFQPEIRSLLERLGKTNVFSRISTLTLNEREKLVDELVKACAEMSRTKTGALISLEQGHSLSDYIKTGTPMNSVVTSELLCSIFVPGTPLHDGAVILQGVKIACAAAYFPPTTQDLPTMYGARHRAAVGISEITDSITIVISEETGNISIAEDGKLTVVSEKSLRDFLLMVICQTQTEISKDKIRKESDAEKDIDELAKEKQTAVDKPSKMAMIFRSKTKNRTEQKKAEENKYTKTRKANDKKEKDIADDKLAEKIVDKKVEKIGIANLVEESMPLDNLFDSIIADREHRKSAVRKQKEETPIVKVSNEPVRKPRVKPEMKSEESPVKVVAKATPSKVTVVKEEPKEAVKQPIKAEAVKEKSVVKRVHKTAANDDMDAFLHDVIEPEEIVLNYKPAKQETTSKTKKQEGGDD